MFSRVDGDTELEECILEIRKANGFDKERYYKQDKKNILNRFSNEELIQFMLERNQQNKELC